MKEPGPNDPCVCQSGAKFKRCCRPLHRGAAAPSPEALMRSRYAAYALGEVDYVIATTDSSGPQFQPDTTRWRAEVEAFCRGTEFVGLRVLEAGEEGDEGHVSFVASLRQAGQDASLRERSRFRRKGGRWLYHSGVHPE